MTQTLPLPLDVKLMNFTASLLFTALLLGGAATALWWALRNPAFAIREIAVGGDTARNDATSLRASVLPRLSGTFFTMDLAAAQAAFQSAPWVRRAVVQREFPDKLRVTLQEHVAAAHWGEGDAAEPRLVNTEGEVFDAAGADDAQTDALPVLVGPEGQSAQLLAMYRRLEPLLEPIGLRAEELTLLPRGGWRMELEQGAVLELGQGAPEQIEARLRQFADTAREVAARHQRATDAIEGADLRHVGGYALRLRGVSTVRGDAASKTPPRKREP